VADAHVTVIDTLNAGYDETGSVITPVMLTTAVDGNPCKAINIACKILVNAAHAAVPGATLIGIVDVAIVRDREKTVGALLGEGLFPILKLGVGVTLGLGVCVGVAVGLGVDVGEGVGEEDIEVDPVLDDVGVIEGVGDGVPEVVGEGD